MESIQAQANHPGPSQREAKSHPSLLNSLANRWRPLVVLTVFLVLVGFVLVPQGLRAGFPLARVVNFSNEQDQVPDSGHRVIEGDAPLPTQADEKPTSAYSGEQPWHLPNPLPTLPREFDLIDDGTTEDRLELTYQRSDGLEISVLAVPPGSFETTLDRTDYTLHRVNNSTVLVRKDNKFAAVEHIFWQARNTVFSVQVLTIDPSRRLTLVEALELVPSLNSTVN